MGIGPISYTRTNNPLMDKWCCLRKGLAFLVLAAWVAAASAGGVASALAVAFPAAVAIGALLRR